MSNKTESRELAHDAGMSQADVDMQHRQWKRRKQWKANAKVLRANGYKYNPGYKAYFLYHANGTTKDCIGIPIENSDVKRFMLPSVIQSP